MVAAVAEGVGVIASNKGKLANAPIGVVTLTNNAGGTTYTLGTDYNIDEFGNISVLNAASIADGSQPKASYSRLDAAQVATSDIIGTVSGNTRTGFKLFSVAKSTFGYRPKILISPDYCEESAVSTEMISQARALEAVAIIDGQSVADSSDSVSDVIAERGVSGTYAGFQTGSDRVILLWPYLKAFDTVTNATVNRAPSPYYAGVLSSRDQSIGYWLSPSNTIIQGVEGVELNLTNGIDDTSSELNQLNAAGITSFLKGFGTGIRIWGNRSAAYPASTDPTNFLNVRRVADILNESIRDSSFPFLGQPITAATIDSIKESTNAFIRSLIQRGALIDGECIYDEDSNPSTQLANGQLVFRVTFMPPPPAERITYESFIDITLLDAINAALASS